MIISSLDRFWPKLASIIILCYNRIYIHNFKKTPHVMQHSKSISKCFLIEKKKAPKRKTNFGLIIVIILGIILMYVVQSAGNVTATGLFDTVKEGGLDRIGADVYGSSEPTDIRSIIINIIQVFLGLLALIFVILMLWAGFKWMTAGGDSKNVEDAKKQLIAALFGLVIILAAWGISYYVFISVGEVTNTEIY